MLSENNLAFLAGLFGQRKPEEILSTLSRIGYKGVEWPLAHFNPREKSIPELKEVVEKTQEYGMEVSEVVVQQDVVSLDEGTRMDRIKLVEECINAAREVGVSTLNLFTGPAPWNPKTPKIPEDISEGSAWDMVFEAFDKFVQLAEKCQVHLAVEGVWGMLAHDFYTTKFLIDKFDSKYLGVNLDPSHGILYGNYDVGWVVKQWGEKIKHVHLKDCVGVPGNFVFPLLGEGKVNWKNFFAALNEIGYDGFLSVEFESFAYFSTVLGGDPVKAAELSMEQLEALTKL